MAGKSVSHAELRRAVDAGRLPPVILLLGSEATLRRRSLELLVAAVRDESGDEPPGGVERLDGTEVGLEEVLDEARSLPLFALGTGDGPSRMVCVARFDRVEIVDAALLEAYLEAPVTETCLVLEAEKMDRRTLVYRALAKSALVVDCEPLKREADARAWIEATVRGRGYEIERGAIVLLTEMAGTSLTSLEQELDKAMLYVGESGTIRARDLEGLLGRSREHSVFELTDALVRADEVAAVELLNRLLDDGEEPLRILAMIAWITRQLVIARDLASRGAPRKQILDSLSGRWNQRGVILDRARSREDDAFVDALAACGDADLFVKRLRDSRPGGDRLRPARGRLEALCRQICAA